MSTPTAGKSACYVETIASLPAMSTPAQWMPSGWEVRLCRHRRMLLRPVVLQLLGVWLFLSGFLLTRIELGDESRCGDGVQGCACQSGPVCAQPRPRFRKAVVVVVDALRYDFVREQPGSVQPFHNQMPLLAALARHDPSRARLFAFRADPPTVTMQRLKGLTAGSFPTFIDAGENFATSAIREDNWMSQASRAGRRLAFAGDDTWLALFPQTFNESHPFPSFNVKDLHTVDNGVFSHVLPDARLPGQPAPSRGLRGWLPPGNDSASVEWDVLVAHMLGVDHVGHTYGPSHPAMARKLRQADAFVAEVWRRLPRDALLVVMGDHGMTGGGNHGGASEEETRAALVLAAKEGRLFTEGGGPRREAPPSSWFEAEQECSQVDLVPTLSHWLGLPIPFASMGVLLPGLHYDSRCEEVSALAENAAQLERFLRSYAVLAPSFAQQSRDEVEAELRAARAEACETLSTRRLRQALHRAVDMCKEQWGQFDERSMFVGIVVMALATLALQHPPSAERHDTLAMEEPASVERHAMHTVVSTVLPLLAGAVASLVWTASGLGVHGEGAVGDGPGVGGVHRVLLWGADTLLGRPWAAALVSWGVSLAGLHIPLEPTELFVFACRCAAFVSNSFMDHEPTLVLACLQLLTVVAALRRAAATGQWRETGVSAVVALVAARLLLEAPAQESDWWLLALPLAALWWQPSTTWGLVLLYHALGVGGAPWEGVIAQELWVRDWVARLAMVSWALEWVRPKASHTLSLLCLLADRSSAPGLLVLAVHWEAWSLLQAAGPCASHVASWAYFFGTAHLAKFSSLHFPAAFVGFPHFHLARGAVLVLIETAGGVWFVYAGRKHSRRASLWPWFAACTVLAAFVMFARRHLMVWAIFAPKLLFDFALAGVAILGSLCFQ
jgi:predicted AlkP superfamily pyrophosphatase or phosphodiesterase